MKFPASNEYTYKELAIFAPVYFCLAYINLIIKLWMTPAWFQVLERNHSMLLNFNYTNNEQSRLMQFYMPELFHKLLGLNVIHAYELNRFLFVFLAFVLFHMYLKRWFTTAESFAGVALLAAVMPLAYMNCLQESAPLLLMLFLLSLWAIRDNKIIMLFLLFFLGGLTNETMLILPAVYFFYHLKFERFKEIVQLAVKTLLISIPLLITILPIRLITRYNPIGSDIPREHLGGAYHWPDNWQGITRDINLSFFEWHHAFYIYFIIIFGVIWIYAFIGYTKKPLFLRRASWMIPFFLISHMITGIIKESRQMLPLAFILIPMAMFFLFSKQNPDDKRKGT